MKRRYLIVDDSPRFLEAASSSLSQDGIDVVGTATTIAEALSQAEALQPDVVLVDVSLGTESGFDLTRRLVELLPQLRSRVVLISTRSEDDFSDLVAESPAAGFVSKSELSARVIDELLSDV